MTQRTHDHIDGYERGIIVLRGVDNLTAPGTTSLNYLLFDVTQMVLIHRPLVQAAAAWN